MTGVISELLTKEREGDSAYGVYVRRLICEAVWLIPHCDDSLSLSSSATSQQAQSANQHVDTQTLRSSTVFSQTRSSGPQEVHVLFFYPLALHS